MRLSILVPIYNERPTMVRALERVLAAPLPAGLEREVVAVDDGSTDGSAKILRELAAAHPGVLRAFRHMKNRGKGAAIRTAIAAMTGDLALIQDADMEYDPSEYPALLRPILEGRADVVYGSRFAAAGERRVLFYRHQLGNRLITFLSNLCTDLNLSDVETCYKAFHADLLKSIPLRSNRFGIEPEITAKIARRGVRVYEVPISYHGRSYAEGKKITWKDGISALWVILRGALTDDSLVGSPREIALWRMAKATRLNAQLLRMIKPSVGNRVLEVGSGIGALSQFLAGRRRVVLSDSEPARLSTLRRVFAGSRGMEVLRVDPERDEDFDPLAGCFDTVFCVNLPAFVERPDQVLARMARVLEPGGRAIVVAPQYPALNSRLDALLGHRRRYTPLTLSRDLQRAGLHVENMRAFNFLGLCGWTVFNRVLGGAQLGTASLRLYNLLAPTFFALEKRLPLPGLSLVAVATRDAR